MQVILHIGQHKSGSKALQSALHANRAHLEARGIAYPIAPGLSLPLRPYEMNHHRLFAAVRAAVDDGERSAGSAAVQAMLDGLQASCPATTERLVLSAEDLFDMHTAHELLFVPARVASGSHLLARECAARGWRPRVVCYLRRQDHLLAAHYGQFIKGSATHHPEFVEFQAAFAMRLESEAILANWEEAFGSGAISVAAYEKQQMPGGIVADFFRRALGLEPPPLTVPFPDDLEAFNITPCRDHLDYIRVLNHRASLGQTVVAREPVLESAFRDRDRPAAGIADWLSPGERAALLAQHELGNRQIAERQGLGATLFQEPLPSPQDPWTPHPGLHRSRLADLDARARAIAAERSSSWPQAADSEHGRSSE